MKVINVFRERVDNQIKKTYFFQTDLLGEEFWIDEDYNSELEHQVMAKSFG